MSEWRGHIDGIRVDRVDGGYAATHPAYWGAIVDDCGVVAAWRLLRILVGATE